MFLNLGRKQRKFRMPRQISKLIVSTSEKLFSNVNTVLSYHIYSLFFAQGEAFQ